MFRGTVESGGVWISTDLPQPRMLQQGNHPMDLQLLKTLGRLVARALSPRGRWSAQQLLGV